MKNTLFILLFSYCFSLIGQESNLVTQKDMLNISGTETIAVHLNTQTILPGEYLYFSVTLKSKEGLLKQKLSKVAYIALVNPMGEKVLLAQMLLKQISNNGSEPEGFLKPQLKDQTHLNSVRGQGDLFIPVSLATGAYTLVGYTQQMLQQDPEDLFLRPLAVINPYTNARVGTVNEIEAKNTLDFTPETTVSNTALEPTIKNRDTITDTKLMPVFGPLEKISLQDLSLKEISDNGAGLSLKEILGNETIATLSIRKKESLESFAYFDKAPLEKKGAQTTRAEITGFSQEKPQIELQRERQGEFQGATISGRIVANDKKSTQLKIHEVSIALSFLGENMPFKLTNPAADGTFSFPINSPINNNNAVLEIMGDAKNDYHLVVNPLPLPHLASLPKGTLQLYPKDLETLTQRSVYNQIENAFNRFKPDSIALENRPIADFSHLESSDYLLEEYTLFPTFEETVFEIISELSYQKTTDGGLVLYCKGVSRNTPIAAPPLLFIDGIPVEDQEQFRGYSTQNIARIKVVQKQLVVGNKIWNGLVQISTKNGYPLEYIKSNNLTVKALQLPALQKKYYQIQKNTIKENQTTPKTVDQLPHFNTQLLWLPNSFVSLETTPSYFYTSSVKGNYELKVFYQNLKGDEKVWTKVFRVE
ncbi:hypothetical protein N9K80_02725 [Flavobacteriaceae bacterium]|nr:hypothetical protein [Flavobacteriaceae bacterium]